MPQALPANRILVVDDEPAVREALDRALRLEGYDVELAADGRQALERHDATRPDAIVLDVLMPVLDGLQTCRLLRGSGDRTFALTRTEYLLLELFMRNPRRVLTREQIFDRVWGYDFGPASNSLEVYVGYLRRKLEERGESRLIHTSRGVGYAM